MPMTTEYALGCLNRMADRVLDIKDLCFDNDGIFLIDEYENLNIPEMLDELYGQFEVFGRVMSDNGIVATMAANYAELCASICYSLSCKAHERTLDVLC